MTQKEESRGYVLKRLIFRISYLINRMLFLLFPTKIGTKCTLNGIIIRRGKGKVIIGNNVKINSSKLANPLGGANRTIFCAIMDGIITIKDNVGISNATIVSRCSVTIEEGVLIGADVKIYDNDFHSLDFRKRNLPGGVDIPNMKPITIKKEAFIGAHSIVLKGVCIGEHSIIGAGSVVTKNVPSNEIWAGNPAKYIRSLK